jgi:hypothetical protein
MKDVLSTEYFDVTVNKFKINKSVKTGNMFSDIEPEEGNSFLILNVSFKNTNTESRMLFDGVVIVIMDGKEYKFDKSETVLAEGWSTTLKQINPMTTTTVNLVYKVPSDIRGSIYYQPARNYKKKKIFLVDL